MIGFCKNCRYWQPDLKELAEGTCHESPAVLDYTGKSRWPATGKDDWCGKWENKVG